MKIKFQYDDSLDCFGIHGVGSGQSGGQWTVWDQFLVQLQGIGVTILLAGIMTFIICVVVEKTVGFRIDH